jgi:hypothetical protein
MAGKRKSHSAPSKAQVALARGRVAAARRLACVSHGAVGSSATNSTSRFGRESW